MSKFNVEVAFNELSKKIAELTKIITAQSVLIETQNKKIDDQKQLIESNIFVISEQKRVIEKLLAKIDERLGSAEKSCDAVITTMPITQSVKELATCTESPALSDRERRATERSRAKGTTTLQKPERLNTSTNCFKTNTDINQTLNEDSTDWKTVVNKKKEYTTLHLSTTQEESNDGFQPLTFRVYGTHT
ncbi:unnamed protein product [Parnassius mnemosyne]|uniref:Uncharacterized protein n=1 Tax=Parnassius mnemosyne TaxID=213953 RepID=A0AAV1MBY9_9NEOP